MVNLVLVAVSSQISSFTINGAIFSFTHSFTLFLMDIWMLLMNFLACCLLGQVSNELNLPLQNFLQQTVVLHLLLLSFPASCQKQE